VIRLIFIDLEAVKSFFSKTIVWYNNETIWLHKGNTLVANCCDMNTTTIGNAGFISSSNFSYTGSTLLPAAKITTANFYRNNIPEHPFFRAKHKLLTGSIGKLLQNTHPF